jgi:hypothetical protein
MSLALKVEVLDRLVDIQKAILDHVIYTPAVESLIRDFHIAKAMVLLETIRTDPATPLLIQNRILKYRLEIQNIIQNVTETPL